MQRLTAYDKSSGFTLIEVGIIVPILIVTILIIFDALFLMISASSLEAGRIDVSYERQSAVSSVESDLALASNYLPTKDSLYPDPYSPPSGWSYEGSGENSRVLIARMYATTLNPLDTSRRPAFINDNDPVGAACDPDNIYANDVQEYNVIYFVQNGVLFRRRVIDTTATLCSPGQYQKLSCPSQAYLTEQGKGTRDSTCNSDDEIVAENVTQFSVRYYDTKTSSTPLSVYTGGTAEDRAELLKTASDAEITLTLNKKVSGQTVSSTSTLRFSKLNAKIEE